ncbi:MAG: fumarylacetoacetate hydrolase family protein [Gammaproteobacteria bacterium]|nr:fumarylacetoacetate hydrolase family protein [Gammaproteobacteria bacterium]
MKLASLANGTRDGRLVVVNRALTRARPVPGIVATLQGALDDWAEIAPRLAAVYQDLCTNTARNGDLAFESARCMAPLPRAFHWVDGSAYVNHVELVRKARGAEMPDDFWHDPLVYQGGSDDLLGPCDDILAADVAHGIDLEAEVAVVTDDVAMGTPAAEAGEHIKLLMLVNDVSLRNLIPGELGKGFGFYQSKPASAFSPVAITPDELGQAWREDKIHLPLVTHVNGTLLGRPECGEDMTFSFAELIAHVTKTRRLRAGAIVGSGTISNYERSRGSACLAEVRMLETLARGKPETPFLGAGDRVRIEMFNGAGESLFGAIDQVVVIADRT